MKYFYFDTAIWMDYYKNKSDRFRPLGEWAFYLINKIIKDNDKIFYLNFVFRELLAHYKKEKVELIFDVILRHKS